MDVLLICFLVLEKFGILWAGSKPLLCLLFNSLHGQDRRAGDNAKARVAEAYLFGSRARGNARKNSDYDFIVKFGGKKSLFDLAALRRDLKKALGKPVDVLTEKGIHPLIRPYIKKKVKLL